MEEVRIETERLRIEAEGRLSAMNERIAEGKEQLASVVDPVGTAKNKMLARQDALIHLLYDEAQATDEMKTLAKEIQECKEVIERKKSWR